MGRWGERFFEGDSDLDEVSYISDDAGILLYQYEVKDGGKDLEATREHFNNGILSRLFQEYATKPRQVVTTELRFVHLALLAMRIGATLHPEHLNLIRSILPNLKVSPKYSSPLFNSYFRAPMKIQLVQALEHYKNDGTTYRIFGRGLNEAFEDKPNLNICGGPGCAKYAHELGEDSLRVCSRCKEMAYCTRECQAADWPYHKKTCGKPKPKPRPQGSSGYIMMNV